MLLGAAWAGTAIENNMLGAAHSAANPLTACYGIVHDEAVGLMLQWIVRFNAEDPAARQSHAELASTAGLVRPEDSPDAAVGALVERLEWLLSLAGMPRWLSERGAERAALPHLAREAAAQWTAGFNPRSITAPDFARLYDAAYSGAAGLNAGSCNGCEVAIVNRNSPVYDLARFS